VLRVVGILIGVWALAAGVIWLVRAERPTPAKIEAYLAANPLEAREPAERAEVIAAMASKVNRLEFEARRELQRTGRARDFFEAMTDEEQSHYLDLTLPEGFKQVMVALNKMKPEKRQELVERALENIEKGGPPEDADRPPVDDAMMQKIVVQGMTAFYEDANAEVKMDFAPVIEQIQQSLRWRD
jgi:hypothetical protein